jgi:hypothetical protein
MTASVLVKHRLYCVAGQGFEPWKASADGFTVRCRPVGLRQAIDATSRALRVPFMESTTGHSRLTTVCRNCCSAALSCPRQVVPKLLTKTQVLGDIQPATTTMNILGPEPKAKARPWQATCR